jgi:signal transduction histidine kinase
MPTNNGIQFQDAVSTLSRHTSVLEACLDIAEAPSLINLERRLNRWLTRLYSLMSWRVRWLAQIGCATTLYLDGTANYSRSRASAGHTVSLPLLVRNRVYGELMLQFAPDQIADANELRELNQLTSVLTKSLCRIDQELLSMTQAAELFFAHAVIRGETFVDENPDLDNLANRLLYHLETSAFHLIIDPLDTGGFRWGASSCRNTSPLSITDRQHVVQLATAVFHQTGHDPQPHLLVHGQELQALIKAYDLSSLAQFQSLLIIPVVKDDTVIGAVIAGEERDWSRQPLPQQSISICSLLAQTMVNALRHSYLVREVTARSQFLETIIDGLGEAIIVTQSQTIVLWNQAATALFGYHADEVYGRHITHVLTNVPVDVVQAINSLWRPVATMKFDWRMPIGQHEIEVSCAVTRLHAHETDLPIVMYAIQKSSYESEFSYLKDELLSVISHELRTPLNGINGFGRLIMERPHMPETMRQEALESLQSSIERLNRLTNDITDAARAQRYLLPMELEDIDIRAVVRSSVREMKLRHPEHHIRTRIARELPLVHGDRLRIKQILDNLVNNAAKYSQPRTSINIYVRRAGDMVALSVTDQGLGIAKGSQQRIFESFYRGAQPRDRHVGGVGLGLSIVKSLVEAHHGSVSVRSVMGKGSTFTITLPCSAASSTEIVV